VLPIRCSLTILKVADKEMQMLLLPRRTKRLLLLN